MSLQYRQAAHAGLLREIIFKMVITTEGARRPQKAGAETDRLLPGIMRLS